MNYLKIKIIQNKIIHNNQKKKKQIKNRKKTLQTPSTFTSAQKQKTNVNNMENTNKCLLMELSTHV